MDKIDSDPNKLGKSIGTRGKGRPKGSVNKVAKSAKEAIQLAAEGLGGAERLIAWAQEDPINERAFWTNIYPKLMPVQVTGEDGDAIRTVTRIELAPLMK